MYKMTDESGYPDTFTPEKNLLGGVLRRAILDFLGSDSSVARDAEVWLFGSPLRQAQSVFSFPWVCEHLGLLPPQVRDQIQRLASDKVRVLDDFDLAL